MSRERIVVVHEGGTPWWVPLVVGLVVAVAVAAASYAAAWWFKKRDVDRENAFRAADLIDQAERIASQRERLDAEGGANDLLRLISKARVRAQPLVSSDLDDRFKVALDYVMTFAQFHPHQPKPAGAWRWLREAVANVREGLVPFLAAPRFLPFRRPIALERSFPPLAQFQAMPDGSDGEELMAALRVWKEAQA